MKPTATSNNGNIVGRVTAENYHSDIATILNGMGNVVLSEYDEFLLCQISLTEEESMIGLLSQSQLTQITLAQEQRQLLDLMTQILHKL
jgi:hypothetical protein